MTHSGQSETVKPLLLGLVFGGVGVGYSIAMWRKAARSSGSSQRTQRQIAAVAFAVAGVFLMVSGVAAAVA